MLDEIQRLEDIRRMMTLADLGNYYVVWPDMDGQLYSLESYLRMTVSNWTGGGLVYTIQTRAKRPEDTTQVPRRTKWPKLILRPKDDPNPHRMENF